MLRLNRQPEVYIALQDYDFSWSPIQIDRFIESWNDGADIWELTKQFKRSKIEIAIIILDLAEKQKIKPRKNGLFGNTKKQKER